MYVGVARDGYSDELIGRGRPVVTFCIGRFGRLSLVACIPQPQIGASRMETAHHKALISLCSVFHTAATRAYCESQCLLLLRRNPPRRAPSPPSFSSSAFSYGSLLLSSSPSATSTYQPSSYAVLSAVLRRGALLHARSSPGRW